MTAIQFVGEAVEIDSELFTYIPAVPLNEMWKNVSIIKEKNDAVLDRFWKLRGRAATPEEFLAEQQLIVNYGYSKQMSCSLDLVYTAFSSMLWGTPDAIEAEWGWQLARQYISTLSGAQNRIVSLHSTLDDQIAEMEEAIRGIDRE